MNEWLIRCGLWIARAGGWAPVESPTVPITHDDAVRRALLAESKLQMCGVERATALDYVQKLERRLAQSILPHVGSNVVIRANELTRKQRNKVVSGEAKRHAVYAQLIKDFPDVSRRELALAIEVALVKEG